MAALALPLIEMSLTTATPGYIALRESAAWIDASTRGKIRMTGEDRARLLHAMTTNHIQALEPGHGCYAFFLNAQGRIQGDVNVLCFEDHLLLDTEPEQRTKVYEHLDRYIIADDVTLEDVTERTATILLQGPEAGQVLSQAGAPVPDVLWSHAAWGPGTVQRVPEGFRLFFPADQIPKLDAIQASEEEARIVRLEQGRPRYGEEISERHLIQETGQTHAVHFSKGCYLGQEIVERVRSQGKVHRALRAVELDTDQIPEPGAKFTKDGGQGGELVSAAFSPTLGKAVGMAYMWMAAAEIGSEFQWDGISGRVRALPQA